MNKIKTSIYVLGAMLSPFAMACYYDEPEILLVPDYPEENCWSIVETIYQQDDLLFSSQEELIVQIESVEISIEGQSFSHLSLEYEISVFEFQKGIYNEYVESLSQEQIKELQDSISRTDSFDNWPYERDNPYFCSTMKQYQESIESVHCSDCVFNL